MQEKFDIKQFIIDLLKRWKIFIIFIIIFGFIFALLPIFKSGQSINVSNENLSKNLYIVINPVKKYNLIGDYIGRDVVIACLDITLSDYTSDKAYFSFIKNLDSNLAKKYNITDKTFSIDKFKQLVSIKKVGDSNIVKFSILQGDEDLFKSISDAYYSIISENIKAYFGEDVQVNLENSKDVIYNNLQSEEEVSNVSSVKKFIKYGIVGGFMGFVLAFLFILIYDIIDDKIRRKKDLAEFNIDFLGDVSL